LECEAGWDCGSTALMESIRPNALRILKFPSPRLSRYFDSQSRLKSRNFEINEIPTRSPAVQVTRVIDGAVLLLHLVEETSVSEMRVLMSFSAAAPCRLPQVDRHYVCSCRCLEDFIYFLAWCINASSPEWK
jgi:hypothetical protein